MCGDGLINVFKTFFAETSKIEILKIFVILKIIENNRDRIHNLFLFFTLDYY